VYHVNSDRSDSFVYLDAARYALALLKSFLPPLPKNPDF